MISRSLALSLSRSLALSLSRSLALSLSRSLALSLSLALSRSTTINNSGIFNNTDVSIIVNSNLQVNFVSEITSESFTVREENPLKAATKYINAVTEDDAQVVLKHFRVKNMEGLIFGHLNVNSITNKFEAIKLLIEGNLDIIIISETKLDNSFPVEQFCIEGYNTPFRLDKNDRSGGILVYIKKDIPLKEILSILPENFEGIFIELKIRNKKWLVFAGYYPKTEYIQTYLDQVSKSLNELIRKFENIIMLGDCNAQITNINIKDFCDTWFKTLDN